MARADAIAFPFLMNQPITRRIAEFRTDDPKRLGRDKARFAEKPSAFRGRQAAGKPQWSDLRAPKNFVCHPVADPRETLLQKKNCFCWCPRVVSQECVKKFPIERCRCNVGCAGAPPIRRKFAVMKSDATEKPRVAENERAFRLVENEMVVFLGSEPGQFDAQFSSHAEVNADPVAAGKFEKHLFSPRFRAEKTRTGNLADERVRVRTAKDAFPRVELHAQDLLTQTGIPLPAKIFHLRQFGHSGI